jgi:hypothetical protein
MEDVGQLHSAAAMFDSKPLTGFGTAPDSRRMYTVTHRIAD